MKRDILFIHLSTNKIRIGINNKLLLDTPNTINKKPVSFIKYIKNHNSIFLNNFPIISNLTNLEFTFDLIFQSLDLKIEKDKYDLILTVSPFLPKYFEENLLKFIFQVYSFKKIQLSPFIFYIKNIKKKDSLIINCGFSSSYVLFNNEKFFLPIGQLFYLDMLYKLCSLKFDNLKIKKNYDFNLISKYLRVSLNYEEESIELVNKLYNNVFENETNLDITNIIIKQNKSEHLREFHKKRSKSFNNIITTSSKSKGISDDDNIYEDSNEVENSNKTINDNNNNENNEDSPEELKKRLKKEALAENLIYHSKIYQLKTKITKRISLINTLIERNKKIYFRKTDPINYLKNLKNKLNEIIKKEEEEELFKRDTDIPKLISILNNKEELNSNDRNLLNKINSIKDSEENIIKEKEKEKESLLEEIREIEPEFIYERIRLNELLTGEYLNKQFLNIELIRIPECLFNPSVFRMNFIGLSEILNILYTDNFTVFLTGDFILKGMKERLELEMRKCINFNKNIGEVIILSTNETEFKFLDETIIYEKESFLNQFK